CEEYTDQFKVGNIAEATQEVKTYESHMGLYAGQTFHYKLPEAQLTPGSLWAVLKIECSMALIAGNWTYIWIKVLPVNNEGEILWHLPPTWTRLNYRSDGLFYKLEDQFKPSPWKMGIVGK
ncbi:MAG: hypothetical protein KDD22_04480, partial [Bdellovibrionales bacterium]|nr:hypothetical protein [Bdellovibrionales bacterium]